MKQCTSCSAANEDGAKFCTYCGMALGVPAAGTVSHAPTANTKKEFLQLPENAKLKKELRTSAIICYICAGITLLVGLFAAENPYVFIDVALLVGLGLGIHLKQSKACAIALAVYAVINTVIGLASTGRFSGWLILLAGVYAVIYTFKLDKAWKQYRQ